MSTLRQEILSIFSGKPADHTLAFSGLISVTAPGLAQEDMQFHETHLDAVKMARAAASTYRVSGFPSAVLPLDMCVEAEALGARVDFRGASETAEYPRVGEFLHQNVHEFTTKAQSAQSFHSMEHKGRIALVCEAIKLLKEDVGDEIVIGGYLPGPFTLLSLLVETGALYLALRKSPEQVHSALEILTDLLANVGRVYHAAGADFLTIHEMGGSPGTLGPKLFESIVLPHLKVLISTLPRPAVLSACGRTNGTMKLLAASGADALSVDQTNDLTVSRAEIPDVLLFGNLDPVGLLSQGTPIQITEAVASVVRSGADAVWPGCDLDLHIPLANLQALVNAANTPNVL
jgi:MtaA/CmuA family methyltransferase